ncbi:NAD-dependent epimerase/dehydratase family protein [Microlunatus flavus]|uniref:Nucleoside-diphosphate-sugar epimerase n=1 Tax=Microlunatus flavus TaxID=1036181 RepID=A0A1H9NDP0_9ACTN|nr:NAD(P)-dependent oxidoreductase [Microlunatus flavus]SER33483.1 Nucleoside-diphosphate-sugar epimerase [Microlunatus flavus]
MRVLVTGVHGKVGRAARRALAERGHEVIGVDLARPDYDGPAYVQADVTDAGDMFAVISGVEAVVHTAGIPEPTRNPAHEVFATNVTGTFNVVEACVRFGVRRLVNLSSDSVTGYTWSAGQVRPASYPIDEDHPNAPVDPYALSKLFGEQLCEAACRRSALTAVSIRATWVLTPETYGSNLGAFLADPGLTTPVFWSYLDVDDLAELVVLAVESETPGHEAVVAAAADNIGGRDIRVALAEHFPEVDVRHVARRDAGGYALDKAHRLLGWRPTRSWRDHLADSLGETGSAAGD